MNTNRVDITSQIIKWYKNNNLCSDITSKYEDTIRESLQTCSESEWIFFNNLTDDRPYVSSDMESIFVFSLEKLIHFKNNEPV